MAAVAAALFERLGRRGAPLAAPVLARLGGLCAAASDAAEAAEEAQDADEGDEGAGARVGGGAEFAGAAAAAMGAAIAHLGPEAVLAALPLNLEEVRVSNSSHDRQYVFLKYL